VSEREYYTPERRVLTYMVLRVHLCVRVQQPVNDIYMAVRRCHYKRCPPLLWALQTSPLVSRPTFCVNSGVIDEHRRLLCWRIAYTLNIVRVSADVEQQPCDVFVTCLRCQHQRGTPLLYKHTREHEMRNFTMLNTIDAITTAPTSSWKSTLARARMSVLTTRACPLPAAYSKGVFRS
jgi:hypothetical protein